MSEAFDDDRLFKKLEARRALLDEMHAHEALELPTAQIFMDADFDSFLAAAPKPALKPLGESWEAVYDPRLDRVKVRRKPRERRAKWGARRNRNRV